MTSRRRTILDALIAAFSDVTIANGYNTDLASAGGAQKVRSPQNDMASLPLVVIAVPEEDKDESRNTHWECQAGYRFELFVEETGSGSWDEQVEDLIEDVEKVLMAQAELQPPLAVTGVQDIAILGHKKFTLDGHNIAGAVMPVKVRYRHNIDDPGAFS